METKWELYRAETGNAFIVVIVDKRPEGVFEFGSVEEAEAYAAALAEDESQWKAWKNDVIDRLNDDGGIWLENEGISIDATAKNMHMVLSKYEEFVSEGTCRQEDPDIPDMMRCGGVK